MPLTGTPPTAGELRRLRNMLPSVATRLASWLTAAKTEIDATAEEHRPSFLCTARDAIVNTATLVETTGGYPAYVNMATGDDNEVDFFVAVPDDHDAHDLRCEMTFAFSADPSTTLPVVVSLWEALTGVTASDAGMVDLDYQGGDDFATEAVVFDGSALTAGTLLRFRIARDDGEAADLRIVSVAFKWVLDTTTGYEVP